MFFGMINKQLTWCLVFLLVFCGVSATEFYSQFEDLELKIPCINNGSFCGGSAVCNLTIFYPNDSLFLNGVGMVNRGTYFSYNLTANETGVLGLYKQQVVCSDVGESGFSLSEFRITRDGLNNELNGLNVIGSILAVIFVITLFIVLGFVLEKKHPVLAVPLIFVGFFLIILLINVARIGLNPEMEVLDAQDEISNMYVLIMNVVILSIIYVFGYVLIYIVKFIMDGLKKARLERQGLE